MKTEDSFLEGEGNEKRPSASEVTILLKQIGKSGLADNSKGSEQLLNLVYGELKKLASKLLDSERTGHTLQPTALVHEAWMKLVDQNQVEWNGKAHFFSIASQSMRRILVDHARASGSEKRGGGWNRVDLDLGWAKEATDNLVSLTRLDRCLTDLAQAAPRQAKIVELRFFGGLSMATIAELLETSLRTIEREWRFARAWLMTAAGEVS